MKKLASHILQQFAGNYRKGWHGRACKRRILTTGTERKSSWLLAIQEQDACKPSSFGKPIHLSFWSPPDVGDPFEKQYYTGELRQTNSSILVQQNESFDFRRSEPQLWQIIKPSFCRSRKCGHLVNMQQPQLLTQSSHQSRSQQNVGVGNKK